jgi:Fe-S-cluster-containing hydrogenase component 2
LRKIIVADAKKCDGCGICELICSISKEGAFNRKLSRIRMVNIEPEIDTAISCRFCEEQPCIAACPKDALTQSKDSGIITVDQSKCNGCKWCIQACDFGAITLHPTGTVMVCDLCNGEPKCIDWCPTKALNLEVPSTIAQKARISVMKRILQ